MNNTCVMLVAASVRNVVAKESTLEGRLRAAFKEARNHFMVMDENEQFAGAIVAVYEVSDEETKERIVRERKALNALSAMVSGIPVDMTQIETNENPIGLMKFWHESAARNRRDEP